MNYLWEVLLQAKSQGIGPKDIRFVPAARYSPYMELSEEFLNITSLEDPCVVQINPYYRFHSIFREMFHPDREEFKDLRESLFQLLVHQLSENDIRMGMTREEYYKKLLSRAVDKGTYGREAAHAFSLFEKEGQETLLEGILALYREGDSLRLFEHMMGALIPDCIVYESNDNPCEVLIYIGRKRTECLEQKAGFLVNQFLGIRYRTELYYEYHFGIVGMEETMKVGEIAIY